jgi:outer membrane receptor protein involved in Fe transport
MNKRISVFMAALTVAFFLTDTSQAQTSRGAVSGTVSDPTGAVVPGATIVLTNTETGVRRSTTSNEAGIYQFDAVDPGSYELRITLAGFSGFLATGLEVGANRTLTINPGLEVGGTETTLEVNAEAEALTIRDSPLRGGSFSSRQVRDLPLVGLNPILLARTLPGVSHTTGSFSWGATSNATTLSVNGQRVRGNNYLLDGTENNDMLVTGVAQPFNIADAVEEVSVQTGNFSVEFGRAGGGVFNVVTKSGTNQIHGTLLWRYQSQHFESVSNVDKLNQTPKSVFNRNVYGFTLGGPVRENKTFFFGGFQQDTHRSSRNFNFVVPTEAAVTQLRALFRSNPRLDEYLRFLGDVRGTAAPIDLRLGLDPTTGIDRGLVRFASAPVVLPTNTGGPQGLVRFDHQRSEAHQISARYIFDSRVTTPATSNGFPFPGFVTDQAARNQNFLLADTYTFSSSFTNEFRFSFGRQRADFNRPTSLSIPEAQTVPQYGIADIAAPGGIGEGLFQDADNFLFQETQTKLAGHHMFRYGAEVLRQLAKLGVGGGDIPMIQYTNAPGYSAFANFLDDFSGPSARIQRSFGRTIFHPNETRQAYFFQDTWKAVPALTLTLGLRYEIFGQPANVLEFPAFSGFDPAQYLVPNRVNVDYNNFGPAFGLAWSPSFKSGWLAQLFGDRKTVWRGGFQVSYDGWFNQIISLQLATFSPNSRIGQVNALATGRGDSNWLSRIPASGNAPQPSDPQGGALDKDLRNPYTERWSFGFQRQLAGNMLLDTSYVGSVSHKLVTRVDLNPRQLNDQRLYPLLGQRWVRTSNGNSAYHSLQSRVERRFAHGFQLTASYTWSRSIDSTSEGLGYRNTQYSPSNLTSVPAGQGGMRLDRGLSDFHRGQRLSLAYVWELPGPTRGAWKQVLGGWVITGITSFQSGTPFTVLNDLDRNNDAVRNDRPDIGNPSAPLSSRALIDPRPTAQRCATGFQNPDTGACVEPSSVRWVQAPVGSLPNASTVGRNTLETVGDNNYDLSLFKSFTIRERKKLEFRWEAINAFNHPQFTEVPQKSLAEPPSRFLNRDFTYSGIRSMWAQVKILF